LIAQKLHKLIDSIPKQVTLVAVSKTKPIVDIQEAYDAGQRDFGENKVQEMVSKYDDLPNDIRWHMIGHLQRNKIKYMAHFVHLIHGVDSLKLLIEINKQAKKNNRIIDCLLQVKIAQEETKFGLSIPEINIMLKSDEYAELKHVKVVGLMGMASFTNDENQVREEFKSLTNYSKTLILSVKKLIISMGMSSDYKLAIEEGTTMIRVGSAIFGVRNYI